MLLNDGLNDVLSRARQYRALHRDYSVCGAGGECFPNTLCGARDVLQIDSINSRRCSNADQNNFRSRNGVGNFRCRTEIPAIHCFQQKFVKSRLEYRRLSAVYLVNDFPVDVRTSDMMSIGGQTCPGDQTYIPCSNDADFHFHLISLLFGLIEQTLQVMQLPVPLYGPKHSGLQSDLRRKG